MIALTYAADVATVVGSDPSTWIGYDRFALTTMSFDVLNNNITGSCQLTSSTLPNGAPVFGSYSIPTTGAAILTLTIAPIAMYVSIALTSTQQSVIQRLVQNTQNALETNLISFGAASGTQSPGT
jgi:hypothetical protein